MKRFVLFFFALTLTSAAFAQAKAQPKAPVNKSTASKGVCCKVIIDTKAASGDLESSVWDATPVDQKAGSGAKKNAACAELNFELVDSKGTAVTGWSVCENSKCPAVASGVAAASAGKAGASKPVERKSRTNVAGTAVTANTPVIDATTLAAGSYTLRARCGTQVIEKQITVAKAKAAAASAKAAKPAAKSDN